LTKPDEQSHGIEVESGTEDLVVDRCILREYFGDGMKVLGRAVVSKQIARKNLFHLTFRQRRCQFADCSRALSEVGRFFDVQGRSRCAVETLENVSDVTDDFHAG